MGACVRVVQTTEEAAGSPVVEVVGSCIALHCSGMENLGRWWETSGGARHLRPPCHGAADDDCWPAPKVGVLLVDTGTPLGASFMGSLHCGAPAPIVAGHRFSSCQVSPAGRLYRKEPQPAKKKRKEPQDIYFYEFRENYSLRIYHICMCMLF